VRAHEGEAIARDSSTGPPHPQFGISFLQLRITPAMEAGKAGHVWGLEEIAALTDSPSASRSGATPRSN